MATLITPAEYARQRGVSRQAVSQKIKSGALKLTDGKLDKDKADADWAASTKQLRPEPTEAVKKQTAYDYQSSRAKRETHEADMAELKLRKQAGDLVELVDVQFAMTNYSAAVRSLIEQLPARLSPMLAAETDLNAVKKILTTESNTLLAEMRQLATIQIETLTTADESHQR